MNVIVVGGGAWGTAFSHLLRGRGHDVTIAQVPGSLWMLVDGEVRVSAQYAE